MEEYLRLLCWQEEDVTEQVITKLLKSPSKSIQRTEFDEIMKSTFSDVSKRAEVSRILETSKVRMGGGGGGGKE